LPLGELLHEPLRLHLLVLLRSLLRAHHLRHRLQPALRLEQEGGSCILGIRRHNWYVDLGSVA
jgi:hypothetical protein